MAQAIYKIEKNGKVFELEGPENASNSQLELAIAEHEKSQKPKSIPTDPHTSYSETGKPKEIERTSKDSSKLSPKTQGLAEAVLNVAGNSLLNRPSAAVHNIQKYATNEPIDERTNVSEGTKDVVAAGLAVPAGFASGPVGASFTAAGTKAVLNKLTGTKQDKTFLSRFFPDEGESSIKTTLEGTIENEALGKVVGAGLSGGKKAVAAFNEYVKPGSVVGPALAENTRTFSQMAEKGKRKVSKVLEDIFSPVQKAERTIETNAAIKQKFESEIEKQTGRKIDLDATDEDTTKWIAKDLQDTIKTNEAASIRSSNAKASALKIMGKQNVVTPEIEREVASKVLDANGNPITTKVKEKLAPVSGPISLNSTYKSAKEFIETAVEGAKTTDPDNPLLTLAKKIVRNSEITNDKGVVIGLKPISFEQAWQWKQDVGDIAFNQNHRAAAAGKFASLYNTFDDDIEQGLATWKNGPKAQQLWGKIKAVVQNRYAQFYPKGETGATVQDLINAKDVQIPKLDEILAGPVEKVQRLLNTGDLGALLNPGAAKEAYSSIKQTNTRKLLKGYAISRIWQSGVTQNADGVATPSPQKMYELWQNSSKTDTMKAIYSAEERANISMFFKDLANVNQKMSGGGSRYLKLIGTKAGVVTLGGGLAESLIQNGSLLPVTKGEVIGGLIGGIILTGNMLGHLMTNKNTARIMQAMVQNRLDMPEKIAARLIASALRGQTVQMQKQDGSLVDMKVGE